MDTCNQTVEAANHRIDHNNHSNNHLSQKKTGKFPRWKNFTLDNFSTTDVCANYTYMHTYIHTYIHTCSTEIKLDCSPVHIFVRGAFAVSYPITTGCGMFVVGALLDADITRPKMKTIVLTWKLTFQRFLHSAECTPHKASFTCSLFFLVSYIIYTSDFKNIEN